MDRTTRQKPPVAYHVREPAQAAIPQALVARDLSVQHATPPRVTEVSTPLPDKPVRGVEGRVSILSARSFARLAACLVGVFQGASAETHIGLTSPAFPHGEMHEPPGGLDDVVGLLSELGVGIFYVAQGREGDHASLTAVNAVLHGLIGQLGQGYLLQQDVPKLFQSSGESPLVAEFDKAISKAAEQIGDDPHSEFARLLSSGRTEAFAATRHPSSLYLANVAEDAPQGTVVGLSKEFAFYLHAGPNRMQFPGRNETVAVPKALELREPGLSRQKEIYGLFQATSQARPAALIVTSQTVTPAEVDELWEHFKGKSAVCMVPLEDGVQAMIVAPLEARSELVQLMEELADRGVGPTRRPPAATLEEWMQDLKGGVVALPGFGEDSIGSEVDLSSDSLESAQMAMLGQVIRDNGAILGAIAIAIAGVSVLVYRCAKDPPREAKGQGDHADSVSIKSAARAARKERQSRDPVQTVQARKETLVPVEAAPVSYSGVTGHPFVPSLPGEIAASITQTILEIQADKENGRAGLKRYLKQKGAEICAMLDPITGGGSQAAASAAIQLSGILESTLWNTKQMRRWLEGEEFMDGVDFDSVLQTVKDYKKLEPKNESLADAIDMLQRYWRLAPRGEQEDVEHKGRQGPAPGIRSARPRNTLHSASAASASQDAATPRQVTIAEIFAFGKKLVGEVKDGGTMHGVRIGKDIYIPSAVVVPHWHLNEDFVVYKHSHTNHIEVARGSNLYPARAGSVGMRLDDTIAGDHQLLRVQAFILTGKAKP